MIFITITNSGYDTFCDYQIENFSMDFMKKNNLIIYCADDSSYQRLNSFVLSPNISVKKIGDKDITGRHAYLQGRFKELMRLKFPIILESMGEFDDDIWFIDNDVIFLKDPLLQGIEETSDILFQADMGEFEHRYGWVCTGCFLIRNRERSKNFLNNIINYQSSVDRGEQEALNDYCKSWPDNGTATPDRTGSILNFDQAKMDILPFHLFQNGRLAFYHGGFENDECVMIHFNHESDFNKKLNNYEKVKNRFSSLWR